jgi:hypothetical protein
MQQIAFKGDLVICGKAVVDMRVYDESRSGPFHTHSLELRFEVSADLSEKELASQVHRRYRLGLNQSDRLGERIWSYR